MAERYRDHGLELVIMRFNKLNFFFEAKAENQNASLVLAFGISDFLILFFERLDQSAVVKRISQAVYFHTNSFATKCLLF